MTRIISSLTGSFTSSRRLKPRPSSRSAAARARKAVIDLNVVMKPGGIAFFATHQTWPLHEAPWHEAPWDFWRLSKYAWRLLLNQATGFEILGAEMGLPGSIVPDLLTTPTAGLDEQPALLGSAVLARKTGPTTLSWDVDLDAITEQSYPG